MQKRHDDLAEQGIGYVFVIAPDKQSIYPDYLPDHMQARLPKISRQDQILEHMRARSDVLILDLRPALLAGRRYEEVYYRTDSHWNEKGAYLAYREIIYALKKWLPDLEPLAKDQFTRDERKQPGDLARMIGLIQRHPENVPTFLIPDPPLARFKEGDGMPKAAHQLGFMQHLTAETSRPEPTRLVFLHDSFGEVLVPMLAHHFQRSFNVLTYSLDRGLIIRHFRANVVVQLTVERRLLTAPIGDVLPPPIPKQ